MPSETAFVTIGIDVNKPVLHWTAMAWTRDAGQIIDYGNTGIDQMNPNWSDAVFASLQRLRDRFGTGWSDPKFHAVFVDCRWMTADIIGAIQRLKDNRWRGFMGLGQGHWKKSTYAHPDRQNRDTCWVGNASYERYVETHRSAIIFADANYWKTWLHNRLAASPADSKPGAITLFSSVDANEHDALSKHLTAEKETITFERGKGYVRVWETLRSSNHWLDSTYIACVAAHRLGFERPKRSVSAHNSGAVVYPAQGDTAPTFYSGGDEGFTAPTF